MGVRVGLVSQVRASTATLGGSVVVSSVVVLTKRCVRATRNELLATAVVRAPVVRTVLGLAAADGEEPEEASTKGEGNTDPDASQESQEFLSRDDSDEDEYH